MADTTTTKPKTASTCTSPRLPCGARRRLSLARSPKGTRTVPAAATAPNEAGPADEQVQHRRPESDRHGERHADAEPLHALPPVPDGGARSGRASAPSANTAAIVQLIAPSTTVKG